MLDRICHDIIRPLLYKPYMGFLWETYPGHRLAFRLFLKIMERSRRYGKRTGVKYTYMGYDNDS
jgi:hypothetical protein